MANEQNNIEQYEFEPIKGYPMLHWKGKRPFTSTQYFPAQLKEVYGEADESGWINKIFWGDNLQVMSHLLKEFRGKIDLIYIDPPFDSKADYKKKVQLKSKQALSDMSSFEEKQYTDIWSNDEYLQFIYERVILLKELLKDTGVIYFHCDWHKSHHIRCIMDEIFGSDRLINEIVWKRSDAKNDASQGSKHYSRIQDTILFYSKSNEYTWNPLFTPLSDSYINNFYRHIDENGERYKLENMLGPGGAAKGNPVYEVKGVSRAWRYSKEKMQQKIDAGLVIQTKPGTVPMEKKYLRDSKGKQVGTWWDDISMIRGFSKEKTGYPTQKPETLIERILEASSKPGDLILDIFMGSGTTQSAASKLDRRFIGADINLGAVQTTTKRLSASSVSFGVYTVNNYDIFRNPSEAKDILIDALNIQRLNSNVIFDGEKDGFKVKVMPVNRIATKEDLNDLIANFPYKQFEERKVANPNKPVEEIMLVCMGHEPGLGAILENECGYKLKVEVVDILRDKADLTFKYDSEAVIKIADGKLVVDKFYPRNLLQKLSQQKEDVTEWREMVESIMIDWNYDGAVMEPTVIDIPEQNEFVAGEYEIPEGASNIKIKITDLLSESYEEVVVHG